MDVKELAKYKNMHVVNPSTHYAYRNTSGLVRTQLQEDLMDPVWDIVRWTVWTSVRDVTEQQLEL